MKGFKNFSKIIIAFSLTGFTLSSSLSAVSAQDISSDSGIEAEQKSVNTFTEENNNNLPDEELFSSEDILSDNENIDNDYNTFDPAFYEQDAIIEVDNTSDAVNSDYSGVGEARITYLTDPDKKEASAITDSTTSEDKSEEEIVYNDGWNDIDGNILYYKSNKPYTGWVNDNGNFFYTFEGVKYTGWKNLGKKEGEKTPHLSFFGDDGRLYTGWHYMTSAEGEKTPHWSYFGNNGWLRTGWVRLTAADGEKIPHLSYFGDNGWLRTGWVRLTAADGEKIPHLSYFGDNGWLRTGWVRLTAADGEKTEHWSYFGDNGWLRTGWARLGQGTPNPDGNTPAHWSYFGDNGWLRTGWVKLGKGTSEPDGNSTPHLSYFGSDGWLKTGTVDIAGMKCTFNNSGWLRLYETVTPHYNQHAYGYGTGCGGVSLFMAMQYKGYLSGWTLQSFMSTMPYSSDTNPNNGFVGSPYNYDLTPENRGIYPAALAKWGSRYGNVTDISGCTIDYMMNEVLNNNPVVALATWNLSNYDITEYSWGKYRDYNHHFFTLVGYDYDHDRYKVMDTLITDGDGSKWVTGASFRNVWNGIKGAVVVR